MGPSVIPRCIPKSCRRRFTSRLVALVSLITKNPFQFHPPQLHLSHPQKFPAAINDTVISQLTDSATEQIKWFANIEKFEQKCQFSTFITRSRNESLNSHRNSQPPTNPPSIGHECHPPFATQCGRIIFACPSNCGSVCLSRVPPTTLQN